MERLIKEAVHLLLQFPLPFLDGFMLVHDQIAEYFFPVLHMLAEKEAGIPIQFN